MSEADGARYLTTALAVYPFEEPGIGPNVCRFDDNVRYNIHVALGDDVARGRETLTYAFDFATTFANDATILQAFLGPIASGPDSSLPADLAFDANQNLRQTYHVSLKRRGHKAVDLGSGVVPPNNQGLVTRFYNQGNDGERPAKGGVTATGDLDPYTQGALCDLGDGHVAFAGQRDDGFYADIQSIFDLDFGFGGPNKPFDSQAGYNVHTIAGVYATTERRQRTSLSKRPGRKGDKASGRFVQVARQGNPLFNEALVLAIQRLDLYPRALMRLGSGAIAALAMVWLVERAFDLRLMAALPLAGAPT